MGRKEVMETSVPWNEGRESWGWDPPVLKELLPHLELHPMVTARVGSQRNHPWSQVTACEWHLWKVNKSTCKKGQSFSQSRATLDWIVPKGKEQNHRVWGVGGAGAVMKRDSAKDFCWKSSLEIPSAAHSSKHGCFKTRSRLPLS